MIDREKVLKALKCCAGTDEEKTCIYKATANDCPYEDLCGEYEDAYYECTKVLAVDVLELLKEQEPIEPKRTVDEHGQVLSCGNCGAWFEVQFQKYCHECGRKVKWDDN